MAGRVGRLGDPLPRADRRGSRPGARGEAPLTAAGRTTGTEEEVPVVVVGGGPVGLAASIALSRWGVRHVLLERHPGTAIHPKARGVDVRTMELFRRWGIERAVQRAGLPAEAHGFFYRGATLTSAEFERFGGGGLAGEARTLSPSSWLVIGQDALEPVLRRHTERLGIADVRFGHELVGIDAGARRVRVDVAVRTDGRRYRIGARYLVAADGAGSRTREALEIPLIGRGPLVRNSSILFRSDLTPLVADRRSAVYYLHGGDPGRPRGYPMSVGNPPPYGALLAINNRDRWLLVVGHPTGDEAVPDAARSADLVRRAVGLPGLELEVLSVMAWTPAARVAERYREGPVFLAGDAAHEMTPSGAFGLNVGIQDADNLGWKLGGVLGGWARRPLLETYQAERRPVAVAAAEQSYLQFAGERPPRPFGNWGMILGARYQGAGVIPDGTAAPDVGDAAVDYVPVARPGHRLPHVQVGRGPLPRSVLDLIGPGFTLVTRDPAWAAAAEQLAATHGGGGAPVEVALLAGDLAPRDPAEADERLGIGSRGAILARPDGIVGWRATADGPDRPSARRLARVLRDLTGG